MIIHEHHDLGWTIFSHITRKNVDGYSGRDLLRDNGVEYQWSDSGDIKVLIEAQGSVNPEKEIIITFEPPFARPHIYNNEIFKNYYAAIIAIDDDEYRKIYGRNLPKNVYRARWANFLEYEKSYINKTKKVICIASLYNVANEMCAKSECIYHLRKPILRGFVEVFKNEFDFYGRAGDAELNYRGNFGPVRNFIHYKKQLIKDYQFSLCFENTTLNGHIEKIIDSLVSRAIPVYVGAKDVGKYVPKDLFIDIRDFDSAKSCAEYILSLDQHQIDEKIGKIDVFMKNPENTKMMSSVALGDEFLKIFKDKGII